MKAILQRVSHAMLHASIHGSSPTAGKTSQEATASIGLGWLVLLGVEQQDQQADVLKLSKKVIDLRGFADENDKTQLSLRDVEGELLIVSQFTLAANCKKGRKPDFSNAAKPDMAKELYEHFVKNCRELYVPERIQTGVFGAQMRIRLENQGPFTLILNSQEL